MFFFFVFFQFFRLFLEDEGASNSFLAVCSATGRRSTNASSRKTRPEARRFVNTNLQHKLKNRGKFNYPKNAWTLQWKGEWTCISQGCFGVLKMTPLDWGGNRILRVLYFPNLKYIRRFLGGFPVLNDLFVWFICPERLFFFPSFSRSAYAKWVGTRNLFWARNTSIEWILTLETNSQYLKRNKYLKPPPSFDCVFCGWTSRSNP